MAEKKSRGRGKPFEKGNQAGKGHGRPPMPLEMRAVKALTRTRFEELLNRFLWMSSAELAAAAHAEGTTVLERMIIAVVSGAIADGDYQRLNFVLDRLVGKVSEPLQLHANINLSMMPRDQVIAMGQEAIAFLKRANAEDTE